MSSETSDFDWDAQKIHLTKSKYFVRSKQEKLIADLLTDNNIPFEYERRLISPDKRTFKYPDFTLFINTKIYYWEHWGQADRKSYTKYMKEKIKWYKVNGFYDSLIETWGGTNKKIEKQFEEVLNKLIYYGFPPNLLNR